MYIYNFSWLFTDLCFFHISIDPWLLPAQVLRRAQFALKATNAEGPVEDGRKSRRPKAKAKGKAKAKAKATPKAVAKAKAKGKAKAKSQSRKKTEPKDTPAEEEGNMEPEIPEDQEPEIAENMEPEIAENKEPEVAENLSNPPAPRPKKTKALEKKVKVKTTIPADSSTPKDEPKKSTKRARGNGGLDCSPKGDDLVEEKVAHIKCFAKRRRPSGQFTKLKWDSLRSAFEQKVKPLLDSYSAHEDCFLSK